VSAFASFGAVEGPRVSDVLLLVEGVGAFEFEGTVFDFFVSCWVAGLFACFFVLAEVVAEVEGRTKVLHIISIVNKSINYIYFISAK